MKKISKSVNWLKSYATTEISVFLLLPGINNISPQTGRNFACFIDLKGYRGAYVSFRYVWVTLFNKFCDHTCVYWPVITLFEPFQAGFYIYLLEIFDTNIRNVF